MITLDAVVVSIALPTIRHDLGGGFVVRRRSVHPGPGLGEAAGSAVEGAGGIWSLDGRRAAQAAGQLSLAQRLALPGAGW